jgi:predicted nucleic acid-binding protein
MAAAEPPTPPAAILYVDTSALLKLLVREAESTAIERELLTWGALATSVITEVELPRAVARAREERSDAVIDGSVVLQGVQSSRDPRDRTPGSRFGYANCRRTSIDRS